METRNQKENNINSISDTDKECITVIQDKLKRLKEVDKITELSVNELESVVLDLLNLKDRHQKYLLRWVKQGYVID